MNLYAPHVPPVTLRMDFYDYVSWTADCGTEPAEQLHVYEIDPH